MMPYSQEQLLEFFKINNITYQLFTHPQLFTCEQAEEIIAQLNIPGMGIKNLFLKDDKKNLYLIVATYDTRVDLKAVAHLLGLKKLRFADAPLLMQHLGVEPGSVTPLAVINDKEKLVQVILDTHIFNQSYIQVHPLKNDATVVITPTDLGNFLKAIHRTYMIYDFTKNEILK